MTEIPPEPALESDVLANFKRGIEEFNSGRYFECHDTLEDVWHGIRGPARDFLQGLIQISVGFYHIRNGNLRGAESQLAKGLGRLENYGDRFLGLNLGLLRREVEPWLCGIRSNTLSQATLPKVPKFNRIS